MRRLSERERKLALILGLVILLVVLVQGFVIPVQRRLKEVNRDLSQRTEVINRSLALSAQIYQLDKDLEVLRAHRQALMVSGETVPEMMKLIGQAGRLASIDQIDIRPLSQEAQNGYARYKIQLEFQTPFLKLKNFLYYLEEAGSPLTLDRVEVSAGKEASDMIRANVIVSGYGLAAGGEK